MDSGNRLKNERKNVLLGGAFVRSLMCKSLSYRLWFHSVLHGDASFDVAVEGFNLEPPVSPQKDQRLFLA
jgi:hypothetical protein